MLKPALSGVGILMASPCGLLFEILPSAIVSLGVPALRLNSSAVVRGLQPVPFGSRSHQALGPSISMCLGGVDVRGSLLVLPM